MHSEPDRDRTVEQLLRQSLKARAGSVSPGPCLEADTLAAWADGALTADELTAAEAHLADCSRCQALLAAIVQSAPAPPLAEPWWRRRRWALSVLVPVTAAAAALTLWIAVPRDDRQRSFEQAPAKADANAPTPPAARERAEAGQPLAERAPAPVVAEGKLQRRTDELRNKAKEETAGAAHDLARSSVSARPAQEAVIVPAAPPAARPAPPSGAATANAVQPSRDSREAFMAKAAAPAEIVSPDRSGRWRLGGAGSVEHSSDGGLTWQAQSTGVAAELTVGASPSSSVCWLVGRRGTVLLSSDGLTWQRVAFPEGVDLIAVGATDARTASVTTADGRRFSTTDAGLTWRQS